MAKRPQRGAFIVVESILPDPHFLTRKYDLTAMRLRVWMQGKAKRTMQNAMKKTVANWKDKPEFAGDYSEPYGTRLQMHVYPAGRGKTNWQRVSDGTGPRMIVSSKGVMKFQENYTPKTTPAGSWGGPGTRSGAWRAAQQVGPHRIEPREFSKKVANEIGESLQQEAHRIIARALKEK